MPETSDHAGANQIGSKSHAQTAAAGMAWVAAAIAVAKVFSFVSQIILGYLLSVETFAVFGLAAATLALVAGFQTSSIPKVLIQKGKDFQLLFSDFSALAFQFGIVGAVILCALGFGLQSYYEMPTLFPVLAITAVSIPILAANTVLIADLSYSFRFKVINQAEVLRSFCYATTLVTAAMSGASLFSVAIATVLAAAITHLFLLTFMAQPPAYLRLRIREFWGLLVSIRSAILAGFLVALAMRADFLVLGRLLEAEALGFYTFGFMLVASLMHPISTGINQVFLPILANLQNDRAALSLLLDRFMLMIVLCVSVFCAVLIAYAPSLIHLAWQGKWDGSQLVIVALLFAMPFRLVATIAGVGFEATGTWELRNKLLILQAFLLATFAGIGAVYGGFPGAILGVIIQRILSGIVDFVVLKHFLCASVRSSVGLLIRTFVPFLIGCAVLFVPFESLGQQDIRSGVSTAITAPVAVILITALMFVLNPSLWRDIRALCWGCIQKITKASSTYRAPD